MRAHVRAGRLRLRRTRAQVYLGFLGTLTLIALILAVACAVS